MKGRRIILDRCRGKACYPTLKDAQTMMNTRLGSSRKRGQRHGRPERLRAYRCDFCRSWHLTHREEDNDPSSQAAKETPTP